jgi:hypothetical protein
MQLLEIEMKTFFSLMFWPACLTALSVLTGCISTEKHFEHYGKDTAAFDLDCPVGAIKSKLLPGRKMTVQGCGRRATYVFVSQVGWVRN